MSFNSLQIMVGFDDDSQKVIERTTGTTPIPGANLFGTITGLPPILEKPFFIFLWFVRRE
jgi:hypothetical protein